MKKSPPLKHPPQDTRTKTPERVEQFAGDSGQAAEKRAQLFLEEQGLVTLATRYRVKRGEIDLIMRDGETTVFVEVRYRCSDAFGGAIQSITTAKIKSLQRASLIWLSSNPGVSRFDLVTIDNEQLNWIRDAFSVAPL